MKPTEYAIRWVVKKHQKDCSRDGCDCLMEWAYRDYASLKDARSQARRLVRRLGGYVEVVRRTGIQDVTPPADGCRLIYDWDEEVVHEVCE